MSNFSIGSRIKKIRQDKGLNQSEFGKLVLHAHKSLVSKWEKGQNLPNNERLKKIAELGNTTVEYLLTGREARDLEDNPIPINLRLHEYSFIKHHTVTPGESIGIILYSILELTQNDDYHYSSLRSIIELKQFDLQNKLLLVTVYIDNLSINKFYNLVSDLELKSSFNSEDHHIKSDGKNYSFLSTYLNQKDVNSDNSNIYLDFSKDFSNVLVKIIRDMNNTPNEIKCNFNFVYFNDHTTETKTINVQIIK
ncbi:hypothetical protein GCM10008929_20250 [Alkalibacterium psychrotolerans]